MFDEITCDRRRLLGTAALMFAAGQLGMIGAAQAQSGKTQPAHQPAIEGQQMSPASGHLPIEGELPSLGGATGWLNSPPLGPSGLRGNVVLIDIWTYTCINWLRQLPYVRAWAEKYTERGLVVIGVHSPEFAFEKDVENVRRAVADLRVEYPVAIDSDHAIWRAFKNEYWPALYIVDAQGRIRHHHFGEGAYEQSERILQHVLGEAGIGGISHELVSVDARGLDGLDHMKEYTCGKQFPLTSLNHSRPGKSISKADSPPRCSGLVSLQGLENQRHRFRGVGKNFFPYMSCVM